jgi:hypothetical protein
MVCVKFTPDRSAFRGLLGQSKRLALLQMHHDAPELSIGFPGQQVRRVLVHKPGYETAYAQAILEL